MAQKPPSSAALAAELDRLLERAGAKERAKIEKHLATIDAGPHAGHGRLWRQLATALGSLTPLAVQSNGKNAWQYFVPDGKYRKQVFALEDPGDGTLLVYLPDVLKEARKKKVVAPTDSPHSFSAPGSRGEIRIEALDSANTPEPLPHYKHMLGWNRKALKLTLTAADDGGGQLAAASALCAFAAKEWADAAAAPAK